MSIIQVIRNPRPEKPRSPFPPALCVFPGFSLPTCLSLLPGLLFMKQVPKAPVRTQTESLSSCERSPPQTGPSSPAPRCPAHHSAGFLRRSTELERAREHRPALCTCRKGWYRNHRTGVTPSASFPSVTVCRSPVCGLLPRAQEGRGGEWAQRGCCPAPPRPPRASKQKAHGLGDAEGKTQAVMRRWGYKLSGAPRPAPGAPPNTTDGRDLH